MAVPSPPKPALLTRQRYPLLKRLVVASSFSLLRPLYIGVYRVLIWWISRQLGKDPSVGAVYLKSGCARDEITPGISDIDLAVIIRDDQPPAAQRQSTDPPQHAKRFSKLVHRIPIFDSTLYRLFAARLEQTYLTGYQDRFLLLEGRQNWKLLHGHPYLNALKEMPEAIRRSAVLARLEAKWKQYTGNFLVFATSVPKDPIARNSMCYRYCCDVLTRIANVGTDHIDCRRSGVFQRMLPNLEGADRAYAERLIRLEKNRFLDRDNDHTLVDGCKDFMLRQSDRHFARLYHHPWLQPLKETNQQVDVDPADALLTPPARRACQPLVDHARHQWGPAFLGAYLTPSVFYEVGSLLLHLVIDPQNLPSITQLQALYQLYLDQRDLQPRPIHLFLLLPHCAYHISGLPFRNNTGPEMIPQAWTPDFFPLLEREDFALVPCAYKVAPQAPFTIMTANFFWSKKLQQRQQLAANTFESDLDFLRCWWRCLQLIAIERSLDSDQIRYPLTLAAIGRSLEAAGIPLPAQLHQLGPAFNHALDTQPISITSLRSKALDYVHQIDPDGHQYRGLPDWAIGSA